MSIADVREYLKQWDRQNDVVELDTSTATVELAAEALHTEPARIAKTISFRSGDGALVVVAAGDTKVDNQKFRTRFGFKPSMLSAEDALRLTGHAVGGICPFALPQSIEIYLDESLRRFATVFPACGSENSMIEVSIDELELYARPAGWVDVCKLR